MAIDKALLEILRCPESRAPLVLEEDYLVSTDPKSRRRYRVEDDIPNMIIEESEIMDEEPWIQVMKRHGVAPGGEGPAEES
jgi:hypothetical protein